MRPEAENWWKQALEDLDSAKKNLKIKKYYLVAFLSQQAAEKALKALFIELKRRLQPKTHNLIRLG
ncbi:MAG TPA: HEPN domain-containing protein, partial [Candidatus Aenigmarchaeota archaeon]|nr:HEPN domain-containing protein [Candidatus Aenigmarchaeota archaeon]